MTAKGNSERQRQQATAKGDGKRRRQNQLQEAKSQPDAGATRRDSRNPPGEQPAGMTRYGMAVRLLATQGAGIPHPKALG
jgi:hypothetical protein